MHPIFTQSWARKRWMRFSRWVSNYAVVNSKIDTFRLSSTYQPDKDWYWPVEISQLNYISGQGMRWGFDCFCWPWDRAFDWSCSPRGGDIWIFLRPTWRYLTADSDEKDWDRTYVSLFPQLVLTCFPLPRFTYAPYGLEGFWKSWSPTGTSESWVDFTVLSSNFVCFSVFLINWTS